MVTGSPGRRDLAARIGARFRGAVSVDDLPSAPCPRLHERDRERFARRYDVAAQRIREIQLRCFREGREQHRRTEEDRDLGFPEDGDEVRAGPDLFFRQQDDGAARHPGAVHLRDAAVVSQRRRERGRIHAREEIEVIGVAQSEVHVTRVRALHALGHPRGPARVEDRRQALRGVIQPVRWHSRGLSLR